MIFSRVYEEAIYYIKDGKYNKLDNAEPGDGITDLIDNKYLEMNDDYYVDITTGERTDEDIDGNIADDKAINLRKNIKNGNDGRFAEDNYTGDIVSANADIPGPSSWSQFSYKLKNPLIFGAYTKDKCSIYADRQGDYFDGDYNLGRLGLITTGSCNY